MPPILLFILLLLFTFGIIFYLLKPSTTQTAVARHLQDIQGGLEQGEGGGTILKEEGFGTSPGVSELIRQIPGAFATLDLVKQSGKEWPVSHVMGVSGLATIITAWIASLFLPGVLLAVLAGVIAGSVPYIYL